MIDGGAVSGADARDRANTKAKELLGGQSLLTEISNEQALVPPGDPTPKAMEAIALR
jgi:hypothetical protein